MHIYQTFIAISSIAKVKDAKNIPVSFYSIFSKEDLKVKKEMTICKINILMTF